MIPGRRRVTVVAATAPASAAHDMHLPDLKPWFDNVSDDYHELPTDDHDAAYDE